MPVDQLLAEQTIPKDPAVTPEMLRETTPARELVLQQPMQAHELGFPAAMRHGVPPDVTGVLAATPNVRVPLRSLGLGAPEVVDLEYTASSRCHRLSNGTFGYVRPFRGQGSAREVSPSGGIVE